MKKIMLVCAAGMSTSLLVANMQKSAEEQNIEIDIFATAASEVESIIGTKEIDVLLLGPQVRYMEKKYKEMMAPKGVPVAVINMSDYGTMNGEKVLETALELAKK